jgi:hypothetical protein
VVTPEKKVKNAVKKSLDLIGAYYFMPIGGAYSHMGVPDIVGCYRGMFFGIECKAGKGKCTTLQEAQLDKIRANNGFAAVVNEADAATVGEKIVRAWHGEEV